MHWQLLQEIITYSQLHIACQQVDRDLINFKITSTRPLNQSINGQSINQAKQAFAISRTAFASHNHIFTFTNMFFQNISLLAAIVLSFKLVVSLSFQVSNNAVLQLIRSSSTGLSMESGIFDKQPHPSAAGNSRSSLTHHNLFTSSSSLSYKSKPYSDDAEKTQTEKSEIVQSNNSPDALEVESADTSESPPPKPRRSRVLKTGVNETRVKTVTTLEAFYKFFEKDNTDADAVQDDQIIIVRFFSHWCKSCQAIAPKYKRLARLNKNVLFLDIPITKENTDMQKELKICAVPYAHIYYPLGSTNGKSHDSSHETNTNISKVGYSLVEELKMGKMYWSDFEDIFKTYTTGLCQISSMDYSDPHSENMIRKKVEL